MLDGGAGSNVVLDSVGLSSVKSAKVACEPLVQKNFRTVKGKAVLSFHGHKRTLPKLKLAQLRKLVEATTAPASRGPGAQWNPSLSSADCSDAW